MTVIPFPSPKKKPAAPAERKAVCTVVVYDDGSTSSEWSTDRYHWLYQHLFDAMQSIIAYDRRVNGFTQSEYAD